MNTSKTSKLARKILALGTLIGTCTLGLTAIGCNHTMDLGRLDLDPSEQLRVGQLAGRQVTVVNNQPNTERNRVGKVGVHSYEGSLRELTDAVVSQLSYELKKRNAVITKGGAKVLRLKVEYAEFDRGVWTIGTNARVRVETGSGYVRNIDIENTTPGTVNRLYEGMVQLAVTEILKDPKIASYLN